MCYCSALASKQRQAIVGETLEVTRHHGSYNWLTAPGKLSEAVCLLDGTIVFVTQEEKTGRLPWNKRTITEDAIFHPWSEGIQGKDVLCFVESGRNIPLELLRPNRTTVKILQIPVVKIEDEPDEIIIAYEQEERDAIGVEEEVLVSVGASRTS